MKIKRKKKMTKKMEKKTKMWEMTTKSVIKITKK
jgi:hypothetical protein